MPAHFTELQARMIVLIRAFGLHQPDRTPCGQPLSVSEAHALMELQPSTRLSQSDLGVKLQLEKSTVSRLVKRLEQRGWVKRVRDTQDNRVVLLSLTNHGEQVSTRLAAARTHKFTRIFTEIPRGSREDVLHALDLLVQAIRLSQKDKG